MTELDDYALAHRPIGDFCSAPASSEEWLRHALSREQVERFDAEGWIGGIRILDDRQVDRLCAVLSRMGSPAHPRHRLFYEFHANESLDPASVLFHALGGWRVEQDFHDLLWAPAFRIAAHQLLAADVRQFHDQLFCKPARDGGVVSWHQDYSYWTWTRPMRHVTCWIALDDASAENGCLRYVPRSHRWALAPITGLTGAMDSIAATLSPEQRRDFDDQVAVELPRGCASFHHPLLMHGSLANRSTRERRAVVLNVVADGATFDLAAHPTGEFGSFPVGRQGERLGGPCYPLLFDARRELGAAIDSLPTSCLWT